MNEDNSSENSSQDSARSEKSANELIPQVEGAEELAEVLERLPAAKRAELLRIVAASESHSGWLPTPTYLREYEAILPGLAERIVALPEREQTHRHTVVEQMVKDDRTLKARGQGFAFALALILVSVSVLLILLGEFAWGARISIFGIVGVVGIFVTGKWADIKSSKADEPEEE